MLTSKFGIILYNRIKLNIRTSIYPSSPSCKMLVVMLKKRFYILTIILVLIVACSDHKVDEKNSENSSDTVWMSVTPKNYLDFKYSKAIAFATVDPFDYSDLYFSKTIDPSKFHDTINITLDSLQINYLNDLLSGRHRKPYPKGELARSVADCFYPRHNIIFLDKHDSVVNYISICFECGNTKQSKPDLADMDNMQSFFNSIGLKVFDRPDFYSQYYDSMNKLRKHNHNH